MSRTPQNIQSQTDFLTKWSPSLHKQTPGMFQQSVKTMALGRRDPSSVLSQLPREILQSLFEEYGKVWEGAYPSYDEAIKHPIRGGPKPTSCYIAIGQSAASLRDEDWRAFAQLALADDDALYVGFLADPVRNSTNPINRYRKGETLRINWSAKDAIVESAYYFNPIFRNSGSGFQVRFKSNEDERYFFSLPLAGAAEEWINFSPIARFNDYLRTILEIPEDSLSNGVILKREYGRALEEVHWRPILIAFTCSDPIVSGPVMANRVVTSRSGFSQVEMRHFLLEVQKCKQLIHPGILRLYGFTIFTKGPFAAREGSHRGNTEADDPWLIQERVYGPNGGPPVSLDDYIHKVLHSPPPIELQIEIARSIAEALVYLHRYIVHRHLSPENVLLVFGTDGKPNGEVKLYNYQQNEFSSESFLDSRGPEPNAIYAAPESSDYSTRGRPSYPPTKYKSGTELEKKLDVYSFGSLLWEMATGTKPWQLGIRSSELARRIRTPPIGSERWNPVARPPLNAVGPSPFIDIIDAAWTHDPEKRPSARTLLGMLSYVFDV